jgi:Carboxymuconolactone decarboxylase family
MSPSITRLEMADFPADLQQALRPRVERLKYLGEFFRCAAHVPDALLGFIQFTESAKAHLDKRTISLIALTVATLKNNAYERNQHERLAVRLGFGREWVKQVEMLTPESAPLLTPHDRQLQTFAIRAAESDGRGAAELLPQVVQNHGERTATAILMVIGRYVAHAAMANTLALAPPVPSIFEDGFTGD